MRTKIEKDMEHRVMTEADLLITNTPVMRANFIRNNNISGDNFVVIPNGYDIEDFTGMDTASMPHNEKFTMVYTGALYGRRKPDNFFKALSELKRRLCRYGTYRGKARPAIVIMISFRLR